MTTSTNKHGSFASISDACSSEPGVRVALLTVFPPGPGTAITLTPTMAWEIIDHLILNYPTRPRTERRFGPLERRTHATGRRRGTYMRSPIGVRSGRRKGDTK